MNHPLFTSVLIGILLVLYVFKKKGRPMTIIAILIGFGLAPVAGGLVSGLFNMIGGMVFGAIISVVAAVAACAWLYVVLKERRDHKMTLWIALLAASVVFSAQSQLPALAKITTTGDKVMQQGDTQLSRTGR